MISDGLQSDSSDFSPRWHAMATGIIAATLLAVYYTVKELVLR